MRKLLATLLVLLLLGLVLPVALVLGLRTGEGSGQPDPVEEAAVAPAGPARSGPAAALSRPREDSVYPATGDPGVDSLRHRLSLAWDPDARTLRGVDSLTFRATADATSVRLDLGAPLRVSSVRLDGRPVGHRHHGKDLRVLTPVVADRRYTLRIAYSGSPRAVPGPTERLDLARLGWTTTADGRVWTMQEPFGAHTWYPVNDQPADKALYDFTITVPAPWVGVANGRLVSRTETDGDTITRWHLDEPASSYLTTIAIGDYLLTRDTTDSGVPVTYWTPPDDARALADLRATVQAMSWIEARLGPYPFSTLGLVLVPAESAMETQTMLTLGDNAYVRSPAIILHELVHQWYGNQVTPSDWRDVWMSEGMTMYLQLVYQAELDGESIDAATDRWALVETGMRRESGPPGAYDPQRFGAGNIYVGPALMWHELRRRLGEERFWAMVRAWPSTYDNGNPTRAQYLDWVERQTGEELSAFFTAWLMDPQTPDRS